MKILSTFLFVLFLGTAQATPADQPDPSKLLQFNVSLQNNRVTLDWVIGQNQTADQFEVERSTDGVHFKTAAYVFGTDKTDTDAYQFYEKAGNGTVQYRIKIIEKNRQVFYSNVLVVKNNPVAPVK